MPRILYIDPQAEDLATALTRAAALGFDTVMLPPPFPPSARGDRFAPASLSVPGLSAIVALARSAGLGVILDLHIARLAAGSGATLGEGLFAGTPPEALLDPRLPRDVSADTARIDSEADAAALGAFWGRYLETKTRDGVEGVRLLGMDAVPAACVAPFLAALRHGAPAAALYVWTPGMAAAAIPALAGHGLAGVFPSLPWWDFAAPWFWREVEALRRVAPLIGAPAAPLAAEEALAPHDPALKAASFRRAAALAAVLGQGWLCVAGQEQSGGEDSSAFTRGLNAASGHAALKAQGGLGFPCGIGGPVLALLRTDTRDARDAGAAAFCVVNTDGRARHEVSLDALLASLSGRFGPLRQAWPPAGLEEDGAALALEPAGVRILLAEARPAPAAAVRLDEASARQAAAAPRLAVEAVTPAVDGGAFAVKRTAGETVTVQADVVFDGHEKIAAALRWRGPGDAAWQETPMRPLGNDRWTAGFPLAVLGPHRFCVLAWRDRFETFRDEIAKKHEAGVDIGVELQEGVALVEAYAAASGHAALRDLAALLRQADGDKLREALLAAATARLMEAADNRPFLAQSAEIPVEADRIGARFASWYEIFPRSMSDDATRHGTFDDVIRHLPRISGMGFDVLYFPPIHPIGRKNRKGRNNSLTPAPDDPGSPYAIGSDAGGHDALHPELGDLQSFARLRDAAAAHGLELAIDFAVQCSPDHPWLREHPGWFDWRPDGSIKYAENPPKKYEDIVNVDFYADGAVPSLWLELCRVVLFWASQGVRLFRVDNPHTKPFPFWEWLIAEVKARHPDAVFLAEAFTRPKIMNRLGKIGFSQSYTYFTWRNTKRELQEYLVELADGPAREFFRPHFFVNTPDINPVFLQQSGRPGFLIRAALAATLSGLWGVYCGFELCEAAFVPGKEEYLDSEKYQIRAWDWDRPGNIVAEVTALNRIRRENPAFQTHLGIAFHTAFNDAVLYFRKATPDRSNIVLVAISLDPQQAQEAAFEVPLWEWGLRDDASIRATDLLTDEAVVWSGKVQRVRLTPDAPYRIWRV
jgi:starch synthase (maltosyl-transferring)